MLGLSDEDVAILKILKTRGCDEYNSADKRYIYYCGNIVFSVLYNEHLEFPCRCQYYLQILKLCKSYILKKSYLLTHYGK